MNGYTEIGETYCTSGCIL